MGRISNVHPIMLSIHVPSAPAFSCAVRHNSFSANELNGRKPLKSLVYT